MKTKQLNSMCCVGRQGAVSDHVSLSLSVPSEYTLKILERSRFSEKQQSTLVL